jgi:hypothetical protein
MATTRQRKLTEKQEAFCDLFASGKSATDSILQAGYATRNPGVMGAQELAKPHIQRKIKWLCDHKYEAAVPDAAIPDTGILNDEQLEQILCQHAKSNPMAAGKLADIRLKRQSHGEGIDTVPLLLSPFLSDYDLDLMRDERPKGVEVATLRNEVAAEVIEGEADEV